MAKRARPIPDDRGFSTLEVLLVVAIMGILAVVALPRIDLYRIQANSAVQIMGTTMVAAQREALTKQHDIILTFDVPNRRMRLIWDANSNSTIDAGERTRSVPLDDRIRFGLGGAPARAFGAAPVNFTRTINGLPALIFHRNGSASGIGGFYVTSSRAVLDGTTKWNRDTRAVEIVRATGRTEWFKYNGTAWTRGL
jgi:prepilin-type N-terminal cleavage/methylation domain-containing protein